MDRSTENGHRRLNRAGRRVANTTQAAQNEVVASLADNAENEPDRSQPPRKRSKNLAGQGVVPVGEAAALQSTAQEKPAAGSRRIESAQEELQRKCDKLYGRYLTEKTEVGNLRHELSLAKEAFDYREQEFSDLSNEAIGHERYLMGLRAELITEKQAAALGWKLLWNQKARIEELEHYSAACTLSSISIRVPCSHDAIDAQISKLLQEKAKLTQANKSFVDSEAKMGKEVSELREGILEANEDGPAILQQVEAERDGVAAENTKYEPRKKDS